MDDQTSFEKYFDLVFALKVELARSSDYYIVIRERDEIQLLVKVLEGKVKGIYEIEKGNPKYNEALLEASTCPRTHIHTVDKVTLHLEFASRPYKPVGFGNNYI